MLIEDLFRDILSIYQLSSAVLIWWLQKDLICQPRTAVYYVFNFSKIVRYIVFTTFDPFRITYWNWASRLKHIDRFGEPFPFFKWNTANLCSQLRIPLNPREYSCLPSKAHVRLWQSETFSESSSGAGKYNT